MLESRPRTAVDTDLSLLDWAVDETPLPPLRASVWSLAAKRVIDICVALVGLAVLAPLFLAVAVAVKRADGGPVLYRARRSGQGGRIFYLYKFRSMVVNADRVGRAVTVSGDS